MALSLYNSKLQDLIKFYNKYEENLKGGDFTPEEGDRFQTIPDLIKWMYDYDLEMLKIRFNKNFPQPQKFKWIGINPCSTNTEERNMVYTLYKILRDKIAKHQWLQNHAFCIEAYTEGGFRPHIHLILITDTRPARIIDSLSKWFGCKPNMIQVDSLSFGIRDKLRYVNGEKAEAKLSYVKQDQDLRDALNIPHLISNLTI